MEEIKTAINLIDRELVTLKGEAQELVKEVTVLLKKVKPLPNNSETPKSSQPKRLWIRFKESKDYESFSIIWTQIVYYDNQQNRPLLRDIVRGPNYKIPRVRFLQHARGYAGDIQTVLWSYEKRFGEIRKQASRLNRSREHLTQYLKDKSQKLHEGIPSLTLEQ